MEAWPEARVRDGKGVIEIKAAINRKREPVTTRLTKSAPLGRNKYFVPLDFDAAGKQLWGWTDRGAAVLDMEHGRIDLKIEWPSEPRVLRAEMSADRKTLFVGRVGIRPEQVIKDGKTTSVYHQTGRLDAYDVNSGKKLPMFDGREPTSIFTIAPSPDGRWLAVNERRKIADPTGNPFRTVLWDLAANRSIDVGTTRVELAFSPDSSMLIANDFNTTTKESVLLQWTVPDPQPKTIATGKDVMIYTPGFSRDGRWMVLRRSLLDRAKPMELEVWDRKANRINGKTTQDPESLSHAVFDPKSRYLVLVDAATGVRILDLATSSMAKAFEVPKKSTIWEPHFSPDGTRFGLIANDLRNSSVSSTDSDSFEQAVLYLVDLSRPTQPERAVLSPGPSSQFVWSPDGRFIVARSLGCMLILDATNVNGGTSKP